MVDAERLDQQVVDREPDRPAPVRVAAEEAARRLARLVVERRRRRRRASTCSGFASWNRDSARRPWSERNSSGSSIAREEPPQPLLVDDREQPPARRARPSSMCWTTARASGRLAVNHSTRAVKSGSRAIVAGPSVVTAASGSSPTIERARSGTPSPSPSVQHVVVEAVLLVPQALVVQRRGDQREVLEELRREVLVGRVVLGEQQRDLEQVLAVHRHPGRAVGLLEPAR